MRKIILYIIFFTALIITSCNDKKTPSNQEDFDLNTLPKKWIRLTKKDNKLVVFNSCDSGNLLLTISNVKKNFEILLHGEQEDSYIKILKINQIKDTVFMETKYIDSNEKQSFKFFWINKDQGLARFITKYSDGFVSDNVFVTTEKQNNFEKIDQPCKECWGDECNEMENTVEPIVVIKKIFDDYVTYQESTESDENRTIMSKNIKAITNAKADDLDVLINIWMYYDPTDFPSRKLVYAVLEKNKKESIKAIQNRIKNKKEWEKTDSAPYSELENLIKALKK